MESEQQQDQTQCRVSLYGILELKERKNDKKWSQSLS